MSDKKQFSLLFGKDDTVIQDFMIQPPGDDTPHSIRDFIAQEKQVKINGAHIQMTDFGQVHLRQYTDGELVKESFLSPFAYVWVSVIHKAELESDS